MMTDDGADDPAQAFAAAQRRLRRRMAWIALALAGVAAVVVAVLVVLSPGPATLPKIRRPYLWKVTSPTAGVAPSHLFGTLHVGYGLPRSALAAQDQATLTVVESDLLARAAEDGVRPVTSADRERLPDRAWQRLARKSGLAVARLQAAPTAQLLGVVLATALPRVEGMDRGLQARAVRQGQRVAFLEHRSLEQVLSGVPLVPAADGAPVVEPTAAPASSSSAIGEFELLESVRMMIDRPGLVREAMWQIASRYASGADGGCRGADAMGSLVGDLNQDWTAAIERHVASGGAFVAIGCSHLDGPGSIVERLTAKGYTVERIER